MLAAGALAVIGRVDPHRQGWFFPPCPFRLLTGWNCPACGGLRMTHDVLHGNLAAAVTDNLFLVVSIPALLAYAAVSWRRGGSRRSAWPAVAAAAIAWTVLRNLPGFPLTPTLLG